MCPTRRGTRPLRFAPWAGLLAAALLAPPAAGEVRLDVGAGAVQLAEDHLDVTVELKNQGSTAAGPVDVDGEIFDHHCLRRVEGGIPPAQTRAVTLRFPPDVPRPGTHALSLLLGYSPAEASPPALSQRAYLLLALGEAPPPAVRAVLEETRLEWAGTARVVLESADGRAHDVEVRLEGPAGFRANDPDGEVAVPAQGKVVVGIPVYRGDLPWDTLQGLLAVVTTAGEGPASTTVATGTARIGPDPAWMPRLRKPLVLLALSLLGAAIFAEAWRRLA